MSIVLAADIALLIFTIAIMMVGFMLALGVSDPNLKFWMNAYAMDPAENYPQEALIAARAFRKTQYMKGACDPNDEDAGSDRWTALSAGCGAFKFVNTGNASTDAQKKDRRGDYFGNCSSCSRQLCQETCKSCAKACMDQTVVVAQDGMHWVTIGIFATLLFCLICIGFNGYLLSQAEWDPENWMLGMARDLNILIIVSGLVLFGFAVYAMVEANDEEVCPDGGCADISVWAALFLALFLIGNSVSNTPCSPPCSPPC